MAPVSIPHDAKRDPLVGDGRASPQDLALIERLLARDEAAFVELVNAHHASLVRVARAFVVRPELAEEIAQETWASVIAGLRRFEGRSSLRTWIFRICSNKAKTRAAREARTTPFSALEGDDEGPFVDPARFDSRRMWADPPTRFSSETPETILARGQAIERLHAVLDAMPASQRAVITLRDLQGLDAEEVCNILELTESNQRVLLHRARSKVRKALEDLYRDK